MPTPLIGRVTRSPAHHDLAAGRGQEPGDQLHDGGLAAARRADHGDELALADAEGGVGQSERGFLAEAVGEAGGLEFDEGACRHFATMRSALGGRNLLVNTLSTAGVTGRPNASETSLTAFSKRTGSTSPMPLAFT